MLKQSFTLSVMLQAHTETVVYTVSNVAVETHTETVVYTVSNVAGTH